jgi:glycosyltransferase involved in cell wall biosynthesis
MTRRKIRVAQVLPWEVVGGVEHSALRIIRATDPERFSHVVFCRRDGPAVQEFFRSAGLEVFLYDAVEPSYHRPWNYLKASLALSREFRRQQIDVVDCQEYLAAYYTALAGRMAGLPVINSVRNRFDKISRRDRSFLWPVNFFTFVSRATWRSFSYRVPEERGAVVYMGMEPPPYDPVASSEDRRDVRREFAIPEGAALIGMTARVADQKDHQTFIRAAAKVAARNPDVFFLVIGEHSATPEMRCYYEDLMELVEANSLGSRLVFTGYRRDTFRLLRALDIFVLSTHLEGLPVAILEAMSQAKPIVATAVDGIPESVIEGKTGLLHAHKDDSGLADQILRLLADPALAGRLGTAARAYCAEHFNQRQFADSVTAVYDRVLKRHGSG